MKKISILLIAIFVLTFGCFTVKAADIDTDIIKEIQSSLNEMGYDCGTPDGIIGEKTKTAIRKYQESRGMELTGEVDDALIERLSANENTVNKQVSMTVESLIPYLLLLGEGAENGDINVSQEFMDNVNNVYIMGYEGAVTHSFADNPNVIDIMDWVSNDTASEEEFRIFRGKLNKLYGVIPTMTNYYSITNETCWVWDVKDSDYWVIVWNENGKICIRWYTRESVSNWEAKEQKNSKQKEEQAKETKDTTGAKDVATTFTNKFGTPTTLCNHPGCNNYIASSGDTNCCTTHSNRCLECNKYIDEDALYCMDCINKAAKQVSSFSNKYGTPTTICAHPGCSNYIASSGDTNCCPTHSNRCLECNKYIDEDALYCMDCIAKVAEQVSNPW